jgi:hypothetical protein
LRHDFARDQLYLARLVTQSGSGGALLRRRPLGTGHARFPGNRLGRALKA